MDVLYAIMEKEKDVGSIISKLRRIFIMLSLMKINYIKYIFISSNYGYF